MVGKLKSKRRASTKSAAGSSPTNVKSTPESTDPSSVDVKPSPVALKPSPVITKPPPGAVAVSATMGKSTPKSGKRRARVPASKTVKSLKDNAKSSVVQRSADSAQAPAHTRNSSSGFAKHAPGLGMSRRGPSYFTRTAAGHWNNDRPRPHRRWCDTVYIKTLAKGVERDLKTIVKRQKEIDFLKDTEYYKRFSDDCPRYRRKYGDPMTPLPQQKCSELEFSRQLRGWRTRFYELVSQMDDINAGMQNAGQDESGLRAYGNASTPSSLRNGASTAPMDEATNVAAVPRMVSGPSTIPTEQEVIVSYSPGKEDNGVSTSPIKVGNNVLIGGTKEDEASTSSMDEADVVSI